MLDDLTAAARGSFAAIDVEGDGHNPESPVEICVVHYEAGAAVASKHWLINPGRPMTEFVQGFHGVTDAMVTDAPTFAEIEDEVREAITGNTVVAHSAKDDLRILRTVLPDVDFLPSALVDTQRLAKNLLPGLDRYRLETVCAALGLEPSSDGRGFHSAGVDAAMAAGVFLRLVPRIPATPRQARHAARMAQVVMQPTELAARLADLESRGITPRGVPEVPKP